MSDETQAPELQPCPFCGGNDGGEVYVDRLQSDGRRWGVACYSQGCIFEGPHRATKREAIKAWNTRAPLPAADNMAEALDRIMARVDRQERAHVSVGIGVRARAALEAYRAACIRKGEE